LHLHFRLHDGEKNISPPFVVILPTVFHMINIACFSLLPVYADSDFLPTM